MTAISRRSFVKTAAAGTAAIAVIPRWLRAAASDLPPATGYFEREFGIDDALCRRVLARALAKGGDFADLFFEHTVRDWLVLEDGKVNRAYGDIALGVGIRTVNGGQVGYGFTQDLTEPAMLAAADVAATIARAAGTEPSAGYAQAALGNRYPLDTQYADVPLETKLRLVQSVNDGCFARSPLVVKVNGVLHDALKRIMVVGSEGAKAEDLQPLTFLAASVTVEKNGRRERASWNLGGRRDHGFYTPAAVDEIVLTAVDRAVGLFEAVQPPAGEMPVVLGPGLTGILLHEAIGHGMEADFNRKQISTYCTMIGKQVSNPAVTIVDDATLPGLVGSLNVDDEGTPGQRTVLVENGVLRSYMHDKISARHYGVAPTGNGRRESYQHYVLPRMRNTYMLPGPATPAEVIRAVAKGIYVEDIANGQVSIGQGDFAFYVSQGRLIEEGRLTAPIKDINIIGNGPKMLANVGLVANDLAMYRGGAGQCGKDGQGVPVGFGLPTVLVKSLTVGGSKT